MDGAARTTLRESMPETGFATHAGFEFREERLDGLAHAQSVGLQLRRRLAFGVSARQDSAPLLRLKQ